MAFESLFLIERVRSIPMAIGTAKNNVVKFAHTAIGVKKPVGKNIGRISAVVVIVAEVVR